MKVVLVKNVPKMGQAGEVCEVKEGYAKNFLFPKGLAVAESDPVGLKVKGKLDKALREKTKTLEVLGRKLQEIKGSVIKYQVKTNDKGQLFASINKEDIVKSIELKYSVKPLDMVGLPIKKVGSHKVNLSFSGGGRAEIIVIISKKD